MVVLIGCDSNSFFCSTGCCHTIACYILRRTGVIHQTHSSLDKNSFVIYQHVQYIGVLVTIYSALHARKFIEICSALSSILF